MAVVLADRTVTVIKRAHPEQRDARGTPLPTAQDALTTVGPLPAAAARQPDMSWKLRIDPRAWPMRKGDQITDDQGNTWYAREEPEYHPNPISSAADCIQVVGMLDPPLVQ